MTTSFPPINYPNKPVPPFTAPAPRNPFPGFFPDMWRNITGKPYITVSSKGLANGLSEYFNDGADFGPDSLQSNGSLTQTSGIQEAGNYAFSQYQVLTSPGATIAVPSIKILDGYYVLNSPITFDPSNYIPSGTSLNAWVIDYSPNAIVFYNGTGYAITIAGNSSTKNMALFVHGSNGFLGSNATGMYYWVFPGTLIPNNSYAVFHDANNSTATSSQYYIYFIGQISLEVLNSAAGGIIHANETVGFYADVIMPGEGQEGIFEVCARYVYIKGAQSVQFVSETNLVNPEVMILEECTGTVQPVSRQVKIVGGYELTVALTSPNIFKINTLDIEDTSGPTSGAFISLATPVGTLRCRNIIAKYASATFIDVQTDGSVANYDVEQGINVPDGYTFASIPVNTPTISANPPASGTVYQNTNPYAIEIDLPVYATTAGTAGYVTIAKGATDTPTAIGNQFVNGSTSSSSVDIIRLRVPAGWYYEFTGSGVTFGTATPFAE